MTEEENRAALDWLAANKDKWEHPCGESFRVLVPEDQVPECVFKLIEAHKKTEERFNEEIRIRHSLGLDLEEEVIEDAGSFQEFLQEYRKGTN